MTIAIKRSINVEALAHALLLLAWFAMISNIGLLSSSYVYIGLALSLIVLFLLISRADIILRIKRTPIYVRILVFFIVAVTFHHTLLELINGGIQDTISILGRSIFGVFLLILTAVCAMRSKSFVYGWRKMFKGLVVVVFASCLVQLFMPESWNQIADMSDRFHSDVGQSGRAFGLMFNALDLVFFCTIALIALAPRGDVYSQKSDGLVYALIIFMLLFTFSRSGLLILCLAFLFYSKLTAKKIFYFSVALAGLFLAYQSEVFYGSGLERLESLFLAGENFFTGHSTRNRSEIISHIIQNSERIPMFGGGLSERQTILPGYWRTHNMFFESWVTLGYMGALSFLGLIFWVAIGLLGRPGNWSSLGAAMFAIASVLIAIMTAGHYWFSFLWYALLTTVIILYLDRGRGLRTSYQPSG